MAAKCRIYKQRKLRKNEKVHCTKNNDTNWAGDVHLIVDRLRCRTRVVSKSATRICDGNSQRRQPSWPTGVSPTGAVTSWRGYHHETRRRNQVQPSVLKNTRGWEGWWRRKLGGSFLQCWRSLIRRNASLKDADFTSVLCRHWSWRLCPITLTIQFSSANYDCGGYPRSFAMSGSTSSRAWPAPNYNRKRFLLMLRNFVDVSHKRIAIKNIAMIITAVSAFYTMNIRSANVGLVTVEIFSKR